MSDYLIWIGSLAAYNAGTLHGRWIDVGEALETTEDDVEEAAGLVMDEVRAILADCPEHGEEWEAMDWEGVGSSVDLRWESFSEVCSLFLGIKRYGEVFARWASERGPWSSALLSFEDRYQGSWRRLEDYGDDLAAVTVAWSSIPDELRSYFDLEAWVRDLEMNGDIDTIMVDGLIHVFWAA